MSVEVNLTRINDAVAAYGVSSRTLRYYEQVGILWSEHPGGSAQRYYSPEALERLGQILVLRKLQIPIKDIVTVFQNDGAAALAQAFVRKLESLDGEIEALSQLRSLVNDFLGQMMERGISKISAITLLYEETEKRLKAAGQSLPVTGKRLAGTGLPPLNDREVRIIRLPPMRVLTSRRCTGEWESLDGGAMQSLFSPYGVEPTPGLRDGFYLQFPGDLWMMQVRIPEEFTNRTPYREDRIPGGLYVVTSCFMDDMDETLRRLRTWIDNSGEWTPDTGEDDAPLRPEMFEELIPWDIARRQNRYQQDLFLPIRPRQKPGS